MRKVVEKNIKLEEETKRNKSQTKMKTKDKRSAKKLPNLENIYQQEAYRETNPMNLCVT